MKSICSKCKKEFVLNMNNTFISTTRDERVCILVNCPNSRCRNQEMIVLR